MTPKQKERIELKIKKIRSILAAERKKFGCYDDSRGLRYIPTSLYLKLQDYHGGQVYLRWFTKNFPDDCGFPEFLFEWAVILFMNGKIKEAERKVVETHFRNTYVLEKYFGRPIQPINKSEYSNVDKPDYTQYFIYSANQLELSEFTHWLSEFEGTEKFKSISKRYIDAQIRLMDEHDPETRHYLVRIDRQLLNEV